MQVKFYLGHSEDCSLGDSTSTSPEKPLQRGGMKGQYVFNFGEGAIHAIKYTVFQNFPAGLMKLQLVTRKGHHPEGF